MRRLPKQPGMPHNLTETNEQILFQRTKLKLNLLQKEKAGFTAGM